MTDNDEDWIEEAYGPDAPRGPNEPRPNDEPYYINSECKFCDSELVMVDDPDDDGPTWYDEFECPNCNEGVYMDWPEEHKQSVIDRVSEAAREEDFTSFEEIKDDPDV